MDALNVEFLRVVRLEIAFICLKQKNFLKRETNSVMQCFIILFTNTNCAARNFSFPFWDLSAFVIYMRKVLLLDLVGAECVECFLI